MVRRASGGLPESSGVTWHARARHCARCLSSGGEALELAAHMHHATPVVVGQCVRQGCYTAERPLSFGARPWCDVPAVAIQNPPAFAWHARARNYARCLSRGGAARELTAAHARRAALVVISHICRTTALHWREASLPRHGAVVRHASGGHPESAGSRVARAGTPLRSLSLGTRRSTRASCARDLCRAGCCRSVR